MTLESIIFTVGKNTGINFVADRSLPQFQRKLSVNLRDVPVSQFLDFASRQMDLHFEIGENLVWIVDARTQRRAASGKRVFIACAAASSCPPSLSRPKSARPG